MVCLIPVHTMYTCMFIIVVVLHRRRICCFALVCMRGVAFKGEFRRKGLCFARAVVHFCCHCSCVISLVESFLGERLAHHDAASNSFRYGLSALALDVEKSSHGADSLVERVRRFEASPAEAVTGARRMASL